MLIAALDFYYENGAKLKPSAAPAFRAIRLVNEYMAGSLDRPLAFRRFQYCASASS
jgi:hypothetical protein